MQCFGSGSTKKKRQKTVNASKTIVVINKVDRDGARPDWALDQTFDLFDKLGATSEQLDFPIVYTSAIQGWAAKEPKKADHNIDDVDVETKVKDYRDV